MKLALLAMVAMALFVVSAVPALASDYELKTNRGGMYLRVNHADLRVLGSFGGAGRIRGVLRADGGINGVWTDGRGEFSCDHPVDGYWSWGRFSFAPLGDGALVGRYSYCDGHLNDAWSGSLR